ncbi:maleylpyruvate isomerase family mycothiol-dependent enzyme [Streptomyces sp. MBT53]|uniref:maleylpyruvate isomerase family mycothiol-dependent enzyme n=1 Tax=Streptomyces sp. MBT53 TaxID=1488384 RepID=UPI001911CF5B|nr:maleylpyruvate isomerase family mycothiol-dependent enzyme [Streptomyces sp. MBT53]MBK6010053.1 maleylpyruvate isomerase family mycothiol-dependent enzyme [Streptomyces sp. MBT53]
MTTTLEFPDLLRLIDERSTAFRAAVAAAPSLDAQVPTCPEWTLLDLAHHLGDVHRRWAANVTAGPADGPTPPAASEAPREREALLAWSAESTRQLLGALREFGADRGCWTWWADSRSPQTSGAVARHQVQEATVHTYDAQITVGEPQPLPEEAALDGVEEFLFTCCATASAWPHDPATVDYHATEGRSWRLALSAAGARATRIPASAAIPADTAYASARATAGELVLFLYGRIYVDSLKHDGERRLFDQLIAWDPEA